MDSHTELNRAQRRQALEEVKRRLTMERLAALRASIPAIPLANDFDIVETARQEEEEDNFLDTFAEEEEEEGCTYDYCHAPLLRLQKAVKERDEALTKRSETIISIKEDNLKLISELHRVRKRYQLLKRQMGILRVPAKERSAKRSLSFQAEADTAQEELQLDQVTGSGDQTEEATASGSGSILIFPGSSISVFLEGFRKTCEGPNPNYKLRENCARMIKRTKAITTVNHYTLTVGAFLKYAEETPPPACRLTKNQWKGINRLMKGINKSMKRPVSIHQVKVKDSKEAKGVSRKTLLECQSLAKAKIPEVLKTLEETRTQRNQYQFYGYLCVYFTSIYGHRPGLYKNMLVKEAKCDQSGMYLIRWEHKTNRDHGMVQMSLTKDEYTWFTDFLKFKHCLPGGKKSQHLFFNSTNTQLKNLPAYLREVWKEMGLPETPSFTDLRTSIVTHAALKGEDTSVAAENQASSKNKRKAREEDSLSEGSTTPEETKVMYQESGTSSRDSEEEEVKDEEQTARQPVLTMPELEQYHTPSKKQLIRRRRMVVAVSPLLVSPIKLKSKSPLTSPIVTMQGMQQVNSNKDRLKEAIASRRRKMDEKVHKERGEPSGSQKEGEPTHFKTQQGEEGNSSTS
ncbi:unnamed protein product [Coregonus sp. 'balchen']|nr:unnamed protein product [Coregonus sp. 'balchen']